MDDVNRQARRPTTPERLPDPPHPPAVGSVGAARPGEAHPNRPLDCLSPAVAPPPRGTLPSEAFGAPLKDLVAQPRRLGPDLGPAAPARPQAMAPVANDCRVPLERGVDVGHRPEPRHHRRSLAPAHLDDAAEDLRVAVAQTEGSDGHGLGNCAKAKDGWVAEALQVAEARRGVGEGAIYQLVQTSDGLFYLSGGALAVPIGKVFKPGSDGVWEGGAGRLGSANAGGGEGGEGSNGGAGPSGR